MSFTRFHDDPCRIKKQMQELTGPGRCEFMKYHIILAKVVPYGHYIFVFTFHIGINIHCYIIR